MEPEGSLPCSQEPATCPYPEPDASGEPTTDLGTIVATVCSNNDLG
jgi:hypothetical protein